MVAPTFLWTRMSPTTHTGSHTEDAARITGERFKRDTYIERI